VNRDEIIEVEDSLGLPLEEFLSLGIEGLQSVASEIDLSP
jgi:predicted hydrolase (HD superfamily)